MRTKSERLIKWQFPGAGWPAIWGVVAGGLLVVNTACGQGQGWVDGCDYATPYTFTTIAGTPGPGGWGDGTNGAAQFNGPWALAVDTNGNVYVADIYNNDLRKVRQAGTNWVVTTIAGTPEQSGSADGTNENATFNAPAAIAIDGAGNLYVADAGNNTIRKLTRVGANWVSSTIAGTPSPGQPVFRDGTNGVATFYNPNGIAVDSLTNVYVGDSGNNVIRRVTPMGTNWVTTTIAGTVSTAGGFSDGTNQNALFDEPAGLAIDGSGNIFVGDTGNDVIRKMTPVGTNWVVTTIAGAVGVPGPADGTNEAALFYCPLLANGPMAIAVDTNDNLYVADAGDGLIRKVSPVGTNWVTTTLAGLYTAAGNNDGTGTNATFGDPTGIAVDETGRVFVGDSANNDIREGTLALFVAAPNLGINHAGAAGSVTIWWPGSGFSLETNANLATTNWGVYGGTVNSNNGTNSVTVPAAAGSLFFRLSD